MYADTKMPAQAFSTFASVDANTVILPDEMHDNKACAFVKSETWLERHGTMGSKSVPCVPSGFDLVKLNRTTGRGGGVAFIAKSHKTSLEKVQYSPQSFEFVI